MKRYEAQGYRVEIDRSLAKVYRFTPERGRQPHWSQVLGSPYHLPAPDFELKNPTSYLTLAVHFYELTTGRPDLRDAITRT